MNITIVFSLVVITLISMLSLTAEANTGLILLKPLVSSAIPH
ncbi:hypothetical protein [Photobacterium aquimaris]|nr:hypothetical protein [Photobacterium aquimaris]